MSFLANIFFTVILLLECANSATLPELYDALIPYAKGDYYKEALKNRKSPDVFRKVKNGIVCMGFEGGSHIGEFYIVPSSGVPMCFDWNVFNVLTSQDVPFLGDDEILVVTTTGGTGLHHVLGVLMSLKDGARVLAVIPLYGYIYKGTYSGIERQDGSVTFEYQITEFRLHGSNIVMTGEYKSRFENVTKDRQSECLNDHHLQKPKETFEVILDKDRKITVKGAEGIQQILGNLCLSFLSS